MDFHGLARRQLQALCKLNKIPANMTNVAMADALLALDIVEGIEEVMKHQSPGKVESGSPEVPRTVTRTSAKPRKLPAKVLESGGTVTQSRARTSRKLVDGVDSVKDEKNDIVKTPAVASSRKCAPAAASRRKADFPCVQKVYSTRRSVRLVEKQLSELFLGESKTGTQPIKIDDELSSEMTDSDIKGDNLAMGSQVMSVKEVSDAEVNSMSAPVETMDNDGVFEGSKVSTDHLIVAAASEIVEEEANVPMGNAEKELKIAGDLEVADEAAPHKSLESLTVSNAVYALRVKEEVAVKLATDGEKDIGINAVFDLVAIIDEASFMALAEQEKVKESINEMMKVETETNKHGSESPAASENGNSNFLEKKAEFVEVNSTEILSAMEEEIVEVPASQISSEMGNSSHPLSAHVDDSMDDSIKSFILSVEPELVTVEKELDVHSPASEQTGDLAKESPTEKENVDRENIVVKGILVDAECFEVPKKPVEEMSIRQLRKVLKGMKISNVGKKDKEENANKYQHQDTLRPTRQALEILPDNTQI